jgi:hypothetical protein
MHRRGHAHLEELVLERGQGDHTATVERVQVEGGLGPHGHHEEVVGEPHPHDLEVRPTRHLAGEHRQQDRQPPSPLDHLVDEGVLGVVVVGAVALEAVLVEEVSHEAGHLEVHGLVWRQVQAPGELVDGGQHVVGMHARVLGSSEQGHGLVQR